MDTRPALLHEKRNSVSGGHMQTLITRLICAVLVFCCAQPLWSQSRPSNATPELNRDEDDNVPDIVQYIVQQRRQWDFEYDSPESRAFTQLINFSGKPCNVVGGRIIPSLVGDGFEAECQCMNGTVRLVDYDDKRVYTERLYVDHHPYELPEIYVKKRDDDVSVFKTP